MKFFVFLLAAAASLPASAEIKQTGKRLSDFPFFVPQEFVAGNESILCIKNFAHSTGIYEFVVFDDEFNETGKISTPAYPELTAELSIATYMSGPLDVTVGATFDENLSWSANASKDEFAAECARIGFPLAENHDDETWYVSDGGEYYYYEIYGRQYPTIAYVWNNVTNKGSLRRFENTYTEWGYTDKLGTPEIRHQSARPCPYYINPTDTKNTDRADFIISQSLFNNDANFEWIVPIIEAVDIDYTTSGAKVEGQALFGTGFRIESQTGATVASVKFPEGLYTNADNNNQEAPHLYIMNNRNYLVFQVSDIDNTNNYCLVYEIDPSSASIKSVGAPRCVSVAPTMPVRGTGVDITLDKPAETGCKVVVTSMSGRTAMTRNVEPGATRTAIDTALLEKGMYVITVTNGKTTRENAKIIVR